MEGHLGLLLGRYYQYKTPTRLGGGFVLEGHLGLEPRTRCLRGSCSNQLS